MGLPVVNMHSNVKPLRYTIGYNYVAFPRPVSSSRAPFYGKLLLWSRRSLRFAIQNQKLFGNFKIHKQSRIKGVQSAQVAYSQLRLLSTRLHILFICALHEVYSQQCNASTKLEEGILSVLLCRATAPSLVSR
eukprot:1975128-Pleurochrysis_carterae.AAC.1